MSTCLRADPNDGYKIMVCRPPRGRTLGRMTRQIGEVEAGVGENHDAQEEMCAFLEDLTFHSLRSAAIICEFAFELFEKESSGKVDIC